MEENKKLGAKLVTLEGDYENRNPVGIQVTPLTKERNEYELKEASTLPDCVRELQVFEGQPEGYVSWISRAQSILNEYQVIKNRPLYRSIVFHIRNKIRGNANTSLLAYGVPDDDWEEIKRTLSLNYADKRDLRTLEHQFNPLNQGTQTLEKFYVEVNNQSSLILNNTPPNDSTVHKRPATEHINPFQKAQRLYHIKPTPALPVGGEERNDQHGLPSAYFEQVLNPEGTEHRSIELTNDDSIVESDVNQGAQNFMATASPASHTGSMEPRTGLSYIFL